jgi:hypothetical protein
MDAIIIEGMNRRIKWLIWALCVFGLGLMISLSTTAIVEAAIAGWIVLSPAMFWGVMVGLVLSWLCPMAGIVLAVKGLRMLVKK